jgi:hypothetical protein
VCARFGMELVNQPLLAYLTETAHQAHGSEPARKIDVEPYCLRPRTSPNRRNIRDGPALFAIERRRLRPRGWNLWPINHARRNVGMFRGIVKRAPRRPVGASCINRSALRTQRRSSMASTQGIPRCWRRSRSVSVAMTSQ